MSGKYKSISHEMQRVLDLGLIDRWLRGMTDIVPQPSPRGDPDGEAFNTHLFTVGADSDIGQNDITGMVGFRQLLTTCAKQNVRLDSDILPDGHLRIAFEPSQGFRASRIFGATYSNVTPASFGNRH